MLCRYSRDGIGIPLMGSLAECMFLFLIYVLSFHFYSDLLLKLDSVRRGRGTDYFRLIQKQTRNELFCVLFFSATCSPCSLGYGVPGVHAVHVAESVYGLDSEPRQEASVQTSAVGTVSGVHGRRCWWSRHTGTQDRAETLSNELFCLIVKSVRFEVKC